MAEKRSRDPLFRCGEARSGIVRGLGTGVLGLRIRHPRRKTFYPSCMSAILSFTEACSAFNNHSALLGLIHAHSALVEPCSALFTLILLRLCSPAFSLQVSSLIHPYLALFDLIPHSQLRSAFFSFVHPHSAWFSLKRRMLPPVRRLYLSDVRDWDCKAAVN